MNTNNYNYKNIVYCTNEKKWSLVINNDLRLFNNGLVFYYTTLAHTIMYKVTLD